MPSPTLLAVAHGTRDPAGAAVYRRLLARVRALRPGLRAELAHLDLVGPSLEEALAGLRGRVVLVPLLLGTGYHVRVDIPAVLAAAPRAEVSIAPALGPDPLLAAALRDRLAEAGWDCDRPSVAARPDCRAPRAVVLAGAGSGDRAANAGTARMARLLQERLGVPVAAAYLSAAAPTPAEAVAAFRARGHRHVAVAGYLLAPGFFTRRAARAGGCLTSAPLGPHEAVARLVLHRYDQALTR
ncbi:sirohydrochlorin chelatase [Kitasatospora sp. HPMI-4]|uniref:sirohydrochlorin chelatase n=1 Tax=Kitasatospora sp. HPMI-4 TaxID=3448443 RepID=UPI003F193C2B